jgi:hypothetical protein
MTSWIVRRPESIPQGIRFAVPAAAECIDFDTFAAYMDLRMMQDNTEMP